MSCRLLGQAACLWSCIAAVAPSVSAEQPEFTQWQRSIEEERINEALTAGNFDDALALAKQLVQDYKKAQDRPRTRGGLSRQEALPQLMELNFLLARMARIVGDQAFAKTLFEKLDDDCRSREVELMKAAQVSQLTENMFSANLASAIDDHQTSRTEMRIDRRRSGLTIRTESRQGNLSGVARAAGALSAASQLNANVQTSLAQVIWFHATIYDEFGSLQLDAGKHRHAENLFRKSSQYWSYFAGLSGGSSSIYRKHLRNYARLYTKDAEAFLRDGKNADSDAALDRAEAYLLRAIERPAISRAGMMSSGTPSTDLPPSEPDDFEIADLRFNSGEYNVARSDQCGEKAPQEALRYLDLAEKDVVRALDILVNLVPDGHPFLAYCFLELAGIHARRVCLAGSADLADCVARSHADDMRAYWKRSQDIVAASVRHRDNHVYRMLDRERVACKRAHAIAKDLDDAECSGDVAADTGDEEPAAAFPRVGSKVRRGPDWEKIWATADGGEDEASIGTIVGLEEDGRIAVKWARTGRRTVHRPGGDGRDEIIDLDGNAVTTRPVASDLSDQQSAFGGSSTLYRGDARLPRGAVGPGMAPPMASPPGYPGSGRPGSPAPVNPGGLPGSPLPPNGGPGPDPPAPSRFGPPGSATPPPDNGSPGSPPMTRSSTEIPPSTTREAEPPRSGDPPPTGPGSNGPASPRAE